MGRLITERDVRAAASVGRIVIPDRAILTPAARELAQKLGVALMKGEPGTGIQDGNENRHPSERSGAAATNPPSHPVAPSQAGTVALGCDHGGFAVKEALKPLLDELGWAVDDVGSHGPAPVDYPVFAARVAERVALGRARFGIMVDGAGIGSAMVANKIPGVRAALCYDLTTAQNAREHNDANVLTLGGTLIGARLAGEIVRTFLATAFAGGRHQRRVAMIRALDGAPGQQGQEGLQGQGGSRGSRGSRGRR